MTIRDFSGFKKPSLPTNIPIIGAGPESRPPQVRDGLGRLLTVGDFLHLQTVNVQPYRILKIAPMPPAPGQPPGLMEVVLQSTVRFAAVRDQGNIEFLRVRTAEEAAGLAGVRVEPREEPLSVSDPVVAERVADKIFAEGQATPSPEDEDPPQTLKDA